MSDASFAPEVEPPEGTTIQTHSVVKYLNRNYAVGLHWHLTHDVSQANAEARGLASKQKSDLWLLRPNELQIGLGSRRRGQKSGMSSLAAEIASELPRRWVGLFKVGDYFYVVGGENAVVDPDTDLAVSDFDQARGLFEDLCNQRASTRYASPEIIARPDFAVDSVTALDLESILADPKRENVLRRLSAMAEVLRFVTPVLLACVACYGATVVFPDQWHGMKVMVGLEEEEKKEIVIVPPMPWAGQPKATAMLDMCLDALSRIPRDGGGWVGTKVVCNGRVVALTMVREGSISDKAPPVTWLDRWVEAQPAFVLSNGGKVAKPKEAKVDAAAAEIVWTLPPIRERWRDADKPPPDLVAEQNRMWRGAEALYLRSQFTKGTPTQFVDIARANFSVEMSSGILTRPLLDRPTTVISAIGYDFKRDSLILDVRLHKSLPIKTGPNIEIQRSPDPRQLETSLSLPPPEG